MSSATKYVNLSLLVVRCRSLLSHWLNSSLADWPARAGSKRQAGRGKSMKLKLLLWYSMHATYEQNKNDQNAKESKQNIYEIPLFSARSCIILSTFSAERGCLSDFFEDQGTEFNLGSQNFCRRSKGGTLFRFRILPLQKDTPRVSPPPAPLPPPRGPTHSEFKTRLKRELLARPSLPNSDAAAYQPRERPLMTFAKLSDFL